MTISRDKQRIRNEGLPSIEKLHSPQPRRSTYQLCSQYVARCIGRAEWSITRALKMAMRSMVHRDVCAR